MLQYSDSDKVRRWPIFRLGPGPDSGPCGEKLYWLARKFHEILCDAGAGMTSHCAQTISPPRDVMMISSL